MRSESKRKWAFIAIGAASAALAAAIGFLAHEVASWLVDLWVAWDWTPHGARRVPRQA